MAEVSDSPAAPSADSASDKLRSKTLSAVGWNTIGSVGSRVVSLVVFMILTRLLDPHALGLLSLGQIVIAFVQAYATQGFADALIQRDKVERAHLDTAFWLNLGVGLALTAGVMLSADTIAEICQEPELSPIVWWLSLSFVLYGISSIQRTMMVRNLDFTVPSLIMLGSDVLGGAVGICLALSGYGVWSLVWQFLSTRIAQSVLFAIWTPWWPSFQVSASAAQDLYWFGFKILGVRTIEFFNQRLPDILVKAFFGTEALGLYSVASRLLFTMSQSISSILAPVAFAASSRLQNDAERVGRGFYTGSELVSVLTAPVFMGLALVAPTALPFLFGPKWDASVPVAQWLTITAMVQATTIDLCGNVLMGMGKPTRTIVLSVLLCTLQLLAILLVASLGGTLVHVALASGVAALVSVPVCFALMGQSVEVSLGAYLRRLSGPLWAALAMAPVVLLVRWLVEGELPQSLAVGLPILAGGVVYGLALSLIRPDLARQILGLAGKLVGRSRLSTP
jgi:PST family polysaccharide transporter